MATNHERAKRHVPFKDTRRAKLRGEERRFTAQEVDSLRERMHEAFSAERLDIRQTAYANGFNDGQNHIRRSIAALLRETQ